MKIIWEENLSIGGSPLDGEMQLLANGTMVSTERKVSVEDLKEVGMWWSWVLGELGLVLTFPILC